MTKKFIKRAQIEFYKKNNGEDDDLVIIDCDIDFAISFQLLNVLWVDENATIRKFSYLKTTTKQLRELADGWYILDRKFLNGNFLTLTMVEMNTSKKYKHLSSLYEHIIREED